MFPTNLTVWTSGVKPNPLVKFVSDGGRPLTDGHFRIRGQTNIYAIGDLVAGPDYGPPTAQNAKAQGLYLADHFNEGLREEKESYKYIEKGKILHVVDKIYVEYGGTTHVLPSWLRFAADWMTAP
jgi:hypothetical protein